MLIEKLKYYLENTPPEQLVKEWNEIEDMDIPGPTIAEYIEFMEEMNPRSGYRRT